MSPKLLLTDSAVRTTIIIVALFASLIFLGLATLTKQEKKSNTETQMTSNTSTPTQPAINADNTYERQLLFSWQGYVESVTENTIRFQTPVQGRETDEKSNQSITVNITTSTTLKSWNISSPAAAMSGAPIALADLKPNDLITVQSSSDLVEGNVINATSVNRIITNK